MKTLALTIISIFAVTALLAQTSMPFKYQAVLRTETGDIITNQDVSLRFSILSGEFSDYLQYSETFEITTNEYGMVALNIGEGIPAEGNFENIDWSEEFNWLKVEMDTDGGMNFTEMGTSRLLAVPFANYAAKADYTKLDNLPELFDGNYNSLTNIPESFNGNYNELSNLPVLFDGEWNSINGKPDFASVATTGNYLDLTNLPTLFSGNYNDLTNKPALFDGTWTNLSGKPTFAAVSESGSYNDLTDQPILFSGDYSDLTNTPALFSGSYNDLTSKPDMTVYATKDMAGGNITNLGDPVNTNDAATKQYVDELEAKLAALEEMLVSYGTMVKDYDGNIYNTVKIGTQIWMAENLKTTHYNDGTPIATYHSANGNSANDEEYGLLYDWATTMNGSVTSSANPSGVNGICPSGWHVPSDAEWKQLETYLGMAAGDLNLNLAWRGTDQGTQLNPGGTTGFNAQFAGSKGSLSYYSFSLKGSYWSATSTGGNTAAYMRSTQPDLGGIYRNAILLEYFLSVRCVKN